MSKKIIITEEQERILCEALVLESSLFDASSIEEIKQILKIMIAKGIAISSMLIASIIGFYHLSPEQAEEIKDAVKTEQKANDGTKKPIVKETIWKLAASDVIATVYNAVPAQCNYDFGTTASMFRLNLYDVLSHRIIAMERTFMKELGLKYGDVVKISGTDKYDGIWQIQDTMNKRFAGQHKIDILVPDNIKHGQWDNVKLYILTDKNNTESFTSKMAKQISKADSAKQVNNLRKQKTRKK